MLVLLLLVTAGLLSPCMAETFHVAPAPATNCPKPCHTLDQYAQNRTLLSGYNITLLFLEGIHDLSSYMYLNNYASLLILQPALPNQGQPPKVIGRSDGLTIRATALNVLIEGLSFENVAVNVNVRGDSEIEEHKVTIRRCDWFISGLTVSLASKSTNITAEISDSSFNGSSVYEYGFIFSSASLSSTIYPHHSLTLQNSVFTEYTEYGINGISNANSYLTIKNSTISQNRQGVDVQFMKKLLIEDSTIFQTDNYGLYTAYIPNVTIVNSEISDNTIGYVSLNSGITLRNSRIDSNDIGLVVSMQDNNPYGIGLIEMDHCVFTRNSAVGIWLLTHKNEKAIFKDCIFDNNRETPILAYQSTFQLAGENVFSNNMAERGGGLALYQSSTVVFASGSTTRFENNTAIEYGGGIYIATAPPILPQLPVTVENGINQEDLHVYNSIFVTNRPCFYSNNANGDTQVKFFGNNAGFGGRDIFGLTKISYFDNTENCSVSDDSIFDFDDSVPRTLQLASDPSRVCFCVNNTPQCQNRAYLVVNETRFPGESFEISVALVGFDFSRVTGSVFASVLDGQAGNISDGQRTQPIDDYVQCTKLTYTVYSNQTSRPLQLSLSVKDLPVKDNHDIIKESVKGIHSLTCNQTTYPLLCTALLTTPIFINITVDKCPLGFQLNNILGVCECDEKSKQLELTCEIQNHTGNITRGGTVWVGVDTAKNETDFYYWSEYCPSDYCNTAATPVQLRSPDSQCRNRTGILCGRCEGNYSLQLGSNRCIHCDNNSSVALLIAFAILGILLVAMITLLDITVANGTINGLIFYANVVWINNAILFPQKGIGYYIITVPIAWINLDLGIEICFSQNLDQLTKSGLQFVFPVYIWCIAGLIILVSRYSIKATRFFGRNSVAVLSTLILLSYGKLFRIITNVFTKAHITSTDSDGSIRNVWSLDGNVEYGITPGHIGLISVALLFILLFLLPFTLTLLLVPFLKAKSDYRLLRWINTFKPFFDTFYGPFKDKQQHQVWTGILLISRVVILIVFSATSTSDPNANILIFTIIATLLLLYTAIVGYLYKQWFASVLEVLYLFNLIILGGAFLFYRIDVREMETLNPVTATSVCIALLQFACIIIFHIAKKIGPKLQRLVKKKKDIESVPENAPKRGGGNKVTTQVVELRKFTMSSDSNILREPVLDT